MRTKTFPREPPAAARMVEEIVGCKGSRAVPDRVRHGVHRPGTLEASLAGLPTEVLNGRVRRLARVGILERIAYPEAPPRVEDTLTPSGGRFARELDGIAAREPCGATTRRGD
ncbi:putative HTH-type transcriptional regulator YtcD [Burkholderiales bacterium]|nr:putative HTH-type transcriptional regulator YtcD [Burkholderiales bacterium]